MIKYKIDILTELKKAGFSSYKIRKDKIMGEATLQQLRNNKLVSWETINIICNLLHCQPGDILIHVKDTE